MIYEAISELNMKVSTPYDQQLCEKAALGLQGLGNDTGYSLSNPTNGRMHDQREFKIKLVLQCFTSNCVPLGLEVGTCTKIQSPKLNYI